MPAMGYRRRTHRACSGIACTIPASPSKSRREMPSCFPTTAATRHDTSAPTTRLMRHHMRLLIFSSHEKTVRVEAA